MKPIIRHKIHNLVLLLNLSPMKCQEPRMTFKPESNLLINKYLLSECSLMRFSKVKEFQIVVVVLVPQNIKQDHNIFHQFLSMSLLKLNEQSCLNGSSPGALSDFCHDISTTTIPVFVPLFSEGTSAQNTTAILFLIL